VFGQSIMHDGDKYRVELQQASATLPEVNRPIVSDGRWLDLDANEIVLDRALARDIGVGVGDTVSLVASDGLVETRVAGLSVSPWRYPGSDPVSYVTLETLRRVEPDESRWQVSYGVRLLDPQQSEFFSMQALPLVAGSHVGYDTWQKVRDEVAFWNELNSIFLGMFSIFALVASGLIVANLISARVLAQYRDIGLLKAVGFTPGQVTRTFLAQHLAVTLLAALAGAAVGLALAPLFLRRLAESMHTTAVPAFDAGVVAIVLLSVLLVVALFTVIPAWRGGRIPTVNAITVGAAPSRHGPSRLAWLARALHLPPVVLLGVKDAFARPWRTLITVAALTLSVITVIFTIGMDATFDRIFGNPALQGEPYDMTIEFNRRSLDEALAIVAANPDSASYHTQMSMPVSLRGGSSLPAGTMPAGIWLRAAGGNVRDAGYIIPEGRMFEAAGEAVAAWGVFQSQGIRIGDELHLSVDGAPLTLTIVGRYLEDDEGGDIVMTGLDTLRQAVPEAQPRMILLDLRSGSDDEVSRALLEASGYDFDLRTLADEAEADAGARSMRTVMVGLSAALLLIGGVNLLSTTLLTVRERRRDFGIFRAVGLTPGQVIASVVSSIGLLALLAACIGIPLGIWIYRTTFRMLSVDSLGAPPEWYTSPPWWQVLLVLPGAVLVAALASALPARYVSRLEVARVLRYQ
jgi:putative ABC transport system permease protein